MSGLALTLLLAPLASVNAETADHSVLTNYETEMAPVFPAPGAGVYAGTLRLRINPDGIVQGYYQTAGGAVEPVAGGKNGNTIWFSIGASGTLRINASVAGADIVGSAQDGNTSDTMSFIAKPSK